MKRALLRENLETLPSVSLELGALTASSYSGSRGALTLISLGGMFRRPQGFRGALSPMHPDARVTG